jgi:hypothetical protein
MHIKTSGKAGTKSNILRARDNKEKLLVTRTGDISPKLSILQASAFEWQKESISHSRGH